MEVSSENISFFIPAYNCAKTIEESIQSILMTNFQLDDELVIVNDHSTDNTSEILQRILEQHPFIKIIHHSRNKGGGAARNTAIENSKHNLLFCLDSDNILIPHSILPLKFFLLEHNLDVEAFQEIHFFITSPDQVTHKWKYNRNITLEDCFLTEKVPGASGNYLFTKESWIKSGGYPEFSGALDTWGFGLRQLLTNAKMETLPDSYYLHRYGHNSYWMRESQKGNMSLNALQLILPYIDLLDNKDVEYIMSKEHRKSWFSNIPKHPLRLKKQNKIFHYIIPKKELSKIISKFFDLIRR